MSKLYESYFDDFAANRLGAQNSIDQYRRVIKEWFDFVGEHQFFIAHHGDVFRFVADQKNRPGQQSRYNPDHTQVLNSTVRRKLEILKSFYKFLVLSKLVAENPFDLPTFARQKADDPKRPAELVPFEYVNKMIGCVPNNTKKGIRDAALLALLFGNGLRRSEVINIRLGNFQKDIFGGNYLKILSAKRGHRTVSLSGWVQEKVSALLKQRTNDLGVNLNPTAFLICGYAGTPVRANNLAMDEKTLYRTFKKYAVEAGLPETISPHSARATWVTKARSMGIDPKEIQKDSGHASIQSIENYDKRYLEISDGAAKQIIF